MAFWVAGDKGVWPGGIDKAPCCKVNRGLPGSIKLHLSHDERSTQGRVFDLCKMSVAH